jgi:hypothetical protein
LPQEETSRTLSTRRVAAGPNFVVWNVVLTLTIGTLICFWIWRQTDYFEEFAALLGLSGILSWVGAFFKIIPESQTEALRTTIYERVVGKPATFLVLFFLLMSVVMATLLSASVEVATFQESTERAVLVYPLEGDPAHLERERSARISDEDFTTLKPGGNVRILVWLPRISGSRHVVKVSGYPDKVITLQGWERAELVVPGSFRRPVVLLRPSAGLINLCQSDPDTPRTLIVHRTNSPTPHRIPFDGHAVWLGCDADVRVPDALQAIWDAKSPSPITRLFWSFPRAFADAPDLVPGEPLRIEMEPGTRALTNSVLPATSHHDFLPQVIDLSFSAPP